MRLTPATMWDLWNQGGPLIGEEGAPHGRVTVEIDDEDLVLHRSSMTVGTFKKGPIRWWQRSDNSQVEMEVPNIRSINTERSIDQDAATCTIRLANQWHFVDGELAHFDQELGRPGYFTFSRGDSPEAAARWDHEENDWNNVLVPNALLRTYQGYGGKDKTINEALVDGNIVLTGVWLVDAVKTSTNGDIELQCRDMAKLLIEQQLYPPLVPKSHYPLTYCRWVFKSIKGNRVGKFVPSKFLEGPTTPVIVAATTDYSGTVVEPDLPDFIGNEPGNGYWVLSNNGEVYNFGNNANHGGVNATWTNSQMEAQDIENTATGEGYWVLRRDGTIFAKGDAVHYGQHLYDPGIGTEPRVWHNHSKAAIARTPDGEGYWVLAFDGTVRAFGNATSHGNHSPITRLFPIWFFSEVAADIAAHPTASGYWTMSNQGRVVAHGAASHFGHPYPAPTAENPAVNIVTFEKITAHPSGNGYWITDQAGQVWAYGAAKFHGQLRFNSVLQRSEGMFANWPMTDFPDFAVDLVSTVSGNGYWIVGNAGGVFPFGDAVYLGSLDRAYEVFLRDNGNYRDYSDIIKELLLWSGWWLYDEEITPTGEPAVYGNIESTGAFSSECLPDDLLDKQEVINAINSIKEIVGYLFYIDEEGGAHFESPNIWTPGNFILDDGTHTTFIPDIDERLQITDYGVQYSDRTARSEIIISSSDPTDTLSDTVSTRFIPRNVELLRGIVRPAVWVNGIFTSKKEQETMAELISLFAWLAQRQGSVTCLANPTIQINDQVRIWERITAETYIHYVRGISTQMDLESGQYLMTLNTHWMGDGTHWALDIGIDSFSFQDLDDFVFKPIQYSFSSNEVHIPGGSVLNHLPNSVLDSNLNTFWITVGNSTQLAPYAVEYIEFDVSDIINIVGVYPWQGNYTVYVSIQESGVWRGLDQIPYDPVGNVGLYVGDYAADISYVVKGAVPTETPVLFYLPRDFAAEKVRITLTNLQRTSWGPFHYRGGLREVIVGYKQGYSQVQGQLNA